jgi:hypothetical protein
MEAMSRTPIPRYRGGGSTEYDETPAETFQQLGYRLCLVLVITGIVGGCLKVFSMWLHHAGLTGEVGWIDALLIGGLAALVVGLILDFFIKDGPVFQSKAANVALNSAFAGVVLIAYLFTR